MKTVVVVVPDDDLERPMEGCEVQSNCIGLTRGSFWIIVRGLRRTCCERCLADGVQTAADLAGDPD